MLLEMPPHNDDTCSVSEQESKGRWQLYSVTVQCTLNMINYFAHFIFMNVSSGNLKAFLDD